MVATAPVAYGPRPSSLADVLDLILDKGLVIDAYVRVSLAGIELLTIDARIVVASVDTYLRFAEAVNRLDLQQTETPGLKGLLKGDDDEDEGGEGGRGEAREGSGRSGARHQDRQRDGQRSQERQRRSPSRALGEGGPHERHGDGDGGLFRKLGDRGRVEPARRGRGR